MQPLPRSRIGGLTIGRATYQPGWRWSEHVGRGIDAALFVEHVGRVLGYGHGGVCDDAFPAPETCSISRPNRTTAGSSVTSPTSLHFPRCQHYAK
jgi:hypothetical protein